MAWRTVCVIGIFLAIALCCSPPFPFTYGQITDPQEVDALLAVRRKLKDPNKNLKWSKTRDPCASNRTGVICYFNDTDGYMQFFPPEWRTLEVEKFWGRKDNFTPGTESSPTGEAIVRRFADGPIERGIGPGV
ncbi:hypothetical protein BUALT_Bualt08G0110600 [Buddleja alternifolia]|uniref:Leucine-rich repeat-containing N-terminal plant-type domain-containing protein n=1 Tax=Buddleja alternifolia TaxID=168488 RepID=A0AAV6XG98_9LAMI|nr:hypothetical protein BUALT_Bualt08G0110600 [Buddleja alternifolia]